jgi:regulator of protease activity HflC (stomatin/prohibitin superfamily)
MFDLSTAMTLAPILIPLVTGGAGIRFVQESQRGVKLRFGKAIRRRDGTVKIYHPGFVFALPTLHSLKRIHVRTQTLILEPQQVMLGDMLVFHVGALVVTRILDTPQDVYASLFEVDDVASSCRALCAATLRDVLLAITHDALSNPDALAEMVRVRVAPRLAEWGVDVVDVKLRDCWPTPETASLILTEVGAGFKAKALKSATDRLKEAGIPFSPTLAAALIGTPVSVALGDIEPFAPPQNHRSRDIDPDSPFARFMDSTAPRSTP